MATEFSSPPHLWGKQEIAEWCDEIERRVHSVVEQAAYDHIVSSVTTNTLTQLMREVEDAWIDVWEYASTSRYVRATRRLRGTCVYLAALLGSPKATQWWHATRQSRWPWSASEGTLSFMMGGLRNWLNDGHKVAAEATT